MAKKWKSTSSSRIGPTQWHCFTLSPVWGIFKKDTFFGNFLQRTCECECDERRFGEDRRRCEGDPGTYWQNRCFSFLFLCGNVLDFSRLKVPLRFTCKWKLILLPMNRRWWVKFTFSYTNHLVSFGQTIDLTILFISKICYFEHWLQNYWIQLHLFYYYEHQNLINWLFFQFMFLYE